MPSKYSHGVVLAQYSSRGIIDLPNNEYIQHINQVPISKAELKRPTNSRTNSRVRENNSNSGRKTFQDGFYVQRRERSVGPRQAQGNPEERQRIVDLEAVAQIDNRTSNTNGSKKLHPSYASQSTQTSSPKSIGNYGRDDSPTDRFRDQPREKPPTPMFRSAPGQMNGGMVLQHSQTATQTGHSQRKPRPGGRDDFRATDLPTPPPSVHSPSAKFTIEANSPTSMSQRSHHTFRTEISSNTERQLGRVGAAGMIRQDSADSIQTRIHNPPDVPINETTRSKPGKRQESRLETQVQPQPPSNSKQQREQPRRQLLPPFMAEKHDNHRGDFDADLALTPKIQEPPWRKPVPPRTSLPLNIDDFDFYNSEEEREGGKLEYRHHEGYEDHDEHDYEDEYHYTLRSYSLSKLSSNLDERYQSKAEGEGGNREEVPISPRRNEDLQHIPFHDLVSNDYDNDYGRDMTPSRGQHHYHQPYPNQRQILTPPPLSPISQSPSSSTYSPQTNYNYNSTPLSNNLTDSTLDMPHTISLRPSTLSFPRGPRLTIHRRLSQISLASEPDDLPSSDRDYDYNDDIESWKNRRAKVFGPSHGPGHNRDISRGTVSMDEAAPYPDIPRSSRDRWAARAQPRKGLGSAAPVFAKAAISGMGFGSSSSHSSSGNANNAADKRTKPTTTSSSSSSSTSYMNRVGQQWKAALPLPKWPGNSQLQPQPQPQKKRWTTLLPRPSIESSSSSSAAATAAATNSTSTSVSNGNNRPKTQPSNSRIHSSSATAATATAITPEEEETENDRRIEAEYRKLEMKRNMKKILL